jgi:hypothetical protein
LEGKVAVSMLAKQLDQVAARLGFNSQLGSVVQKAAGLLAKAVPPGTVPPGAEQALLQKLFMAQKQNAANVAQMRQGAQPGAGGAGAMPGMAAPQAPRPPTMPGMAA